MFFESVWDNATAILFIKDRLVFYHVTGEKATFDAGAPSVLIAYGEENAEILKNSGVVGKFLWCSDKNNTSQKICEWKRCDFGMFGCHDYEYVTTCGESYDCDKVRRDNYCPNCGGKIV